MQAPTLDLMEVGDILIAKQMNNDFRTMVVKAIGIVTEPATDGHRVGVNWIRDLRSSPITVNSSYRQTLTRVADTPKSRALIAELISNLDLANGAEPVVAWPTIEWVKDPVDLNTGSANGSPSSMRHFADCHHWVRNADGNRIGAAPFVASDKQMAALPPCKDCVAKAKRSNHVSMGPRLTTQSAEPTHDPETPMPILLDVDETDVTATVQLRREQSHLRRHLLGGAAEAACALCGRILPSNLLVAAHIVPRRLLDDAQRLDFASAAMLACTLGCDALFEFGYIVVNDDGTLASGRHKSDAVQDAIDELTGRRCSAFSPKTAVNFRHHAALHGHRS